MRDIRGVPSLEDILCATAIRPKVVGACSMLIDAEVAGKRGLGGFAVKAGYAVVQAIKPGFVRGVIDRLLPEFCRALEPQYLESGPGAAASGFAELLSRDRRRTAEALLEVTDRRVAGASPPVRKTYEKLRGGARDPVEAAIPGLAKALIPFLGTP
jgi:hypothetical protein